jgi:hypothetical protein
MKMSRLVVFILLVGGILAFFTMQSELDENGRWAFVGGNLLLAIIWVFLGDNPGTAQQPAQRKVVTRAGPVGDEGESSLDLPEVVTKDDLDGASLRERKMAKVASSQQEDDENQITVEPDDDLEEVAVSIEEVHVADEYVVEVSPQQQRCGKTTVLVKIWLD